MIEVVHPADLDLACALAEGDGLARFPAVDCPIEGRRPARSGLKPRVGCLARTSPHDHGHRRWRRCLRRRERDCLRQSGDTSNREVLRPADNLEQDRRVLAPLDGDLAGVVVQKATAAEKLPRNAVDRLLVEAAVEQQRVDIEPLVRGEDLHPRPRLIDDTDESVHRFRHVNRADESVTRGTNVCGATDTPTNGIPALAVGHIAADLLLRTVVGREGAAPDVGQHLAVRRQHRATPGAVDRVGDFVAAPHRRRIPRGLGGHDRIGQ